MTTPVSSTRSKRKTEEEEEEESSTWNWNSPQWEPEPQWEPKPLSRTMTGPAYGTRSRAAGRVCYSMPDLVSSRSRRRVFEQPEVPMLSKLQPEMDEDSPGSSPPGSPILSAPRLKFKMLPNGDCFGVPLKSSKEWKTYFEDLSAFQAQQDRIQERETLKAIKNISTPGYQDIPNYNSRKKPKPKLFVRYAQSVVGLSVDRGHGRNHTCTGTVIRYSQDTQSALILTSFGPDATLRVPDTKVFVHLPSGVVMDGRIKYHGPFHHLVFVEITSEVAIPHNASFNTEIWDKQSVYALERDADHSEFTVQEGSVVKLMVTNVYTPSVFQESTCKISEYGTGGPLVDCKGRILGINFSWCDWGCDTLFLPASIITRCLYQWTNFGRIARPMLGLKVTAVCLQEIARLEKILQKYEIDDGLIVTLMAPGSYTEHTRIRMGDIIISLGGQCISSTIQFETRLLDICTQRLELNRDASNVDLEVSVYLLRKAGKRKMKLTGIPISDRDCWDTGYENLVIDDDS